MHQLLRELLTRIQRRLMSRVGSLGQRMASYTNFLLLAVWWLIGKQSQIAVLRHRPEYGNHVRRLSVRLRPNRRWPEAGGQ